MKKTVILCAALALTALSLTSCQKEEQTISHKFFATAEQAQNDKCMIDENMMMYWEGDSTKTASHISIYQLNAENNIVGMSDYYPSQISADGRSAVLTHHPLSFMSDFEDNVQGPFFATPGTTELFGFSPEGGLYLGPSTPQYTDGHYCMPMVAYGSSYGDLKFKHVMGVLKIVVTMPPASGPFVFYAGDTMEVSCTNSEYDKCCASQINMTWNTQGEFAVTSCYFKQYGSWYTQSSTNIAAPMGNGVYYIPLPVGQITDLKFHMIGHDGFGATHHFVKTMNSTSTITIERAGITTVNLSYDADNIRDIDYM